MDRKILLSEKDSREGVGTTAADLPKPLGGAASGDEKADRVRRPCADFPDGVDQAGSEHGTLDRDSGRRCRRCCRSGADAARPRLTWRRSSARRRAFTTRTSRSALRAAAIKAEYGRRAARNYNKMEGVQPLASGDRPRGQWGSALAFS